MSKLKQRPTDCIKAIKFQEKIKNKIRVTKSRESQNLTQRNEIQHRVIYLLQFYENFQINKQ